MKHIFTLILSLCALSSLAQIPQIARVSKTGTTTIYTDLKKVIAEARMVILFTCRKIPLMQT